MPRKQSTNSGAGSSISDAGGALSGANLTVTQRPVDQLVPYARNARTHSEAQLNQIAEAIRAFGWTNPILVDSDNGIIAGHGRLLAARKLGLSNVPVIELAGLSEAQRRQLVLADNRLAMNAGWDEAMLRLEIGELTALGIDLTLAGFGEAELATLAAEPHGGLTDPDETPEVQGEAVSRPGDIWQLGRHRLICGDATNPDDVAALLDGVTPHLMVTDPPYGVKYKPSWRNDVVRSDGSRVAARATGEVLNDDRADWREAWALFEGHVAYVWHGALHAAVVAESLEAAGFAIRSQIIWDKTRLVIGRGDYHWQHEPCWYAVRTKGNWTGDRKQTTLWNISSKNQDAETVHGTQKPVECMRRPIVNNTSPGDAIYEPFLGSGTTLIAAESVKRICFAVELSPSYVDVAVRRWQSSTGKKAIRYSDRRLFDDLAAQMSAENG